MLISILSFFIDAAKLRSPKEEKSLCTWLHYTSSLTTSELQSVLGVQDLGESPALFVLLFVVCQSELG
jgi:hypothetical protein